MQISSFTNDSIVVVKRECYKHRNTFTQLSIEPSQKTLISPKNPVNMLDIYWISYIECTAWTDVCQTSILQRHQSVDGSRADYRQARLPAVLRLPVPVSRSSLRGGATPLQGALRRFKVKIQSSSSRKESAFIVINQKKRIAPSEKLKYTYIFSYQCCYALSKTKRNDHW